MPAIRILINKPTLNYIERGVKPESWYQIEFTTESSYLSDGYPNPYHTKEEMIGYLKQIILCSKEAVDKLENVDNDDVENILPQNYYY